MVITLTLGFVGSIRLLLVFAAR
jgi:hypothetical protein